MHVEATQRTASISSKGQLVIPAEVRQELGLTEGVRVSFVIDDDRLIIQRVRSRAERRDAWLAQAFADYVADAPKKVWTDIDGEAFKDAGRDGR
jgi:AbrB family looped-hinge helix DNA binding protein